MENVFKFIAQAFIEAKLKHVLIGGFALNAYTAGRQTKDVELMLTTSDRDKAIGALQLHGYSVSDSNESFVRLQKAGAKEFLVDLLLTDQNTLDQILKEGKIIEISGNKFTVPSVHHLIALKLHAIKQNKQMRELKDLPDIITLIKENNIDAQSPAFRDLCLKFGTEDLFKKVLLFLN